MVENPHEGAEPRAAGPSSPARATSSTNGDGGTIASSSSVNAETETSLRGQLQQIVEARARRGQPIGVGRPAELAQQPGGIEDAGIRPLRPVRFDEADDPHRVEMRVRRRGGVEQPHSAAAGPRRECLSLDPSAHGRPELGDRQRPIVVPAVRIAQGDERADDGRPRAHLPLSGARVCRLWTLARRDELEHRGDLTPSHAAPPAMRSNERTELAAPRASPLSARRHERRLP